MCQHWLQMCRVCSRSCATFPHFSMQLHLRYQFSVRNTRKMEQLFNTRRGYDWHKLPDLEHFSYWSSICVFMHDSLRPKVFISWLRQVEVVHFLFLFRILLRSSPHCSPESTSIIMWYKQRKVRARTQPATNKITSICCAIVVTVTWRMRANKQEAIEECMQNVTDIDAHGANFDKAGVLCDRVGQCALYRQLNPFKGWQICQDWSVATTNRALEMVSHQQELDVTLPDQLIWHCCSNQLAWTCLLQSIQCGWLPIVCTPSSLQLKYVFEATSSDATWFKCKYSRTRYHS